MLAVNATLVVMVCCGSPAEAAPTAAQIRNSVQKAIPYIQEQGVWWIEKKKCVSCHRVGNMIWTLTAAQQRGFTVSDRLQDWRAWATKNSFEKNDKGRTNGAGNREGLAQILLAPGGADAASDAQDSNAKLLRIVAAGQSSDGSWQPGGQLPAQKRTKTETTDVTTMWLALAISASQPDGQNSVAMEKALTQIAASSPGKSSEWYAVRLLLAKQSSDAATIKQVAEQLRKRQQSDGGWPWLAGDESDALGTGLSLHALLRSGVDREDDAIRRAQRFLLTTQLDDGSWAVKGTKAKKATKVQETASYWGTTWAALGLITSLPE